MRRCGGAVVLLASLVLGCEDPGTFGPSGPSGPDLRIDSLDVPKLRQGETVTVTVVVRSSGTEPVPAPFSVSLTVSTDSGYATDYCGPFEWRHGIADGDLAPGDGITYQADVPVAPTDPVRTTLYFLAVADSSDEVEESLESNNRATVVAEIAPPPSPDLVVSSCRPDKPLHTGGSATLTTRIENAGELPANAPFTVSLLLYKDSGRSDLFGSKSWPQDQDLGPGETAQFSMTVSIPSTYAANYLYFTATVDVSDSVSEGYEDNNTLEGMLRVGRPDLVVDASLPEKAASDSLVPLTLTVKNQGDGASPPTSVRFTLYIVMDDVRIDVATYSTSFGALEPGQNQQKSELYWANVPAGTTVGVTATVDPTNSIAEWREDNNTDEASCEIW